MKTYLLDMGMDKDMVEDKGKAVDNIVDMADMELDYNNNYFFRLAKMVQ
jgi:hypothetical protein